VNELRKKSLVDLTSTGQLGQVRDGSAEIKTDWLDVAVFDRQFSPA
jgi:hypothetical protein